jgi:gamma-glutamyltranspeptidase / glutathione hydrolase
VMRRAYRERTEYLGDPDFVRVPVAGLLDRGYTAALMKNFDPAKATPSASLKPGKPAGTGPGGDDGGEPRPKPAPRELFYHPLFAESSETTHYSIVDGAGNAVANTYTLNDGFGSGVTIPGAGFLMNNEMDDFTAKPGVPNFYGLIQGESNAIAPHKRPLSSMTPTFVFKDGQLCLVTGTPGGSTIINTVLQVITNVIDHTMPVSQAVEAPRIFHQWMPDVINYEPYGLAADVETALRAKGHKLSLRNLYGNDAAISELYIGDAQTIAIDPKTNLRLGAADPRKPDAKAVGF